MSGCNGSDHLGVTPGVSPDVVVTETRIDADGASSVDLWSAFEVESALESIHVEVRESVHPGVKATYL